jgi:phage tail sheath gpL-like
MPIKVTGNTVVSSAANVQGSMTKPILVIATKEADGTATALQLVKITGTSQVGDLFGADSKVISMVKYLILNGAQRIYAMAVPAVGGSYVDTAACYAAALAESMKYPDIKIIQLDTFTAAVLTELATHLGLADGEDIYRYSVVSGSAIATVAAWVAIAASLNNKRIICVGPYTTLGDTNVDGAIVAAAVAGAISSETSDPALPMNNVEIKGFDGVSSLYLKTDRDSLVEGGVTPLILQDGVVIIHRMVTTYTKLDDNADTTWSELTTVMIADYVMELQISTIRGKYKRTKQLPRILAAIKTDVLVNLKNTVKAEIIDSYDENSLSVKRDDSDAYGALVEYAMNVVTPLYNVTITQNMSL